MAKDRFARIMALKQKGSSGVDDVARQRITAHAGNADIHVTAAEKTSWNNKAELSDIPTTLPDEVARAAINAHSGNAEIHVTADEKARWNAVNYINPNLLMNPDFRINQRGLTQYSTLREYTADRWLLIQGSINVVDDGITVSPNCVFDQRQESPLPLGICTFSAKINGTVASVKVNITGAQTDYYSLPNTSIMVSFFQKSIRVFNSSGSDWVTINNFKLELGSVATPFCPPDPATELAKCQRYYQIRSAGDIDPVDLRPTMATITDIKQRSDGNYEYIAEL